MKDLNIGEVWANYSYSYINTSLGDAHRNEFTLWNNAYLKKPTTAEDIEMREEDMDS